MNDTFKEDDPPKPTGRPPKPGKPPLYKDRRAHRIELRNKISGYKEEINELKNFKTDDESKKVEIEQKMSVLKTRLKECEMEKESIEQFNHTQFVKNVEKSREDESRFDKESHGQTRFFKKLTMNTESENTNADSLLDPSGDESRKLADTVLVVDKEDEVSLVEPVEETGSSEPPEKKDNEEEVETESSLSPIEILPNTIV
jgi:hypothetical protein